ncbi:CRISPR-associated protein Cas5 [Desulfobacca acetoxidans]|uniref:CRISPR-associated protein Cas5 n=1 Tax=Desulfobacca acetoxidans (strain ATCC 700848 / DSM 11109 / ASRB2) TaxID=880072 RepID=F2NJ28_DESAR|nr:CRISPR-associated protein Cas5 [Desulfobacca acetoxidans]AEB07986.1 CRISPR-associated protein Cas5 [Desulfobacca acetoxidans DSM 11109]
MIALEFRLKLSSMYSIRVPYSYQCARTYPLPAPSTIKGLCANALWQKEGENPVKLLKDIQNKALGATARAEHPIAVSSCTVRVIPMDARLRQYAFTPYIDCLIAFKDGEEELGKKIAESLKVAPIYLGDSESLACVLPESVELVPEHNIKKVFEGDDIPLNSLVRFDLIKNFRENNKGVVLYMQEDPVAVDAVLERYLAPLCARGDAYYPLEERSYCSSGNGFFIRGRRIAALFPEPPENDVKGKKIKNFKRKKT